MISNNSLSAFSAATTTAQTAKPTQLRLVRDNVAPSASSSITKKAIPNELPAIAPPRGSLLNVSV